METTNTINRFAGKYEFLSNFYNADVEYNGLQFLNSEAAFQAQKTLDEGIRKKFTKIKANKAKAKGRNIQLREDWEDIKDYVMYEVCKAKFDQNENLKKMLINTGTAKLVEGNTWNDQYWGVSNGKGKNKLGHILMKIRGEYKTEEQKCSETN